MNSTVPMFMTVFLGWNGTGGDARPPSILTQLVLAGRGDALFEYIERNVGFVFADDERRRDADRARATTQKQDAALERQLDDAIALLSSVLFGLLVLDDLDADHQPVAPDIAHELVFARPVRHAF